MVQRILVIGTYPIANAQHGGQKRTAAIVNAYKSAFPQVVYTAIFFKGFYKEYSDQDIPISQQSEKKALESIFMGDVVCGEAIYDDPAVKLKMRELLLSLRPQVIHVEQPYPYLGLKKLLAELNISPKIIFGSQNIEAPMKREILENANLAEDKIVEAETLIANLEQELSAKSDLVAACTDSDLTAHKKMGAKNTVLASNGIEILPSSEQADHYWQTVFKKAGINRTALFVGSAHPPNWIGFFDIVGKGLGYVPSDARIVIAGSICDYFKSTIKAETLDVQDATFWLRAYPAGRVSDDRLSALLKLADVIILPITEGGGSNLKTAEAILADKKVVATDHGLRSFEWFKEFPNVWIANDQASFQKSVAEALNTDKISRTSAQQELAQQVKWPNRLSDLVEKVREL